MAQSRTQDLKLTLLDHITVDLRRRIVSGDLPGGSRLVVDDLEDTYKTSHIPIREAIRRLESEGLLIHQPNVGTYVVPLSQAEAYELYDLRIMVEPTVAARSVKLRTDADVQEARSAIRAMKKIDPCVDPVGFQDAHIAFHWSLLRPGANPTVESVLLRVWRATGRYLVFMYADPNGTRVMSRVATSGAAHHDLLFKLWQKGDDGLAAVMTEHLQSMSAGFAEILSAMPLYLRGPESRCD